MNKTDRKPSSGRALLVVLDFSIAADAISGRWWWKAWVMAAISDYCRRPRAGAKNADILKERPCTRTRTQPRINGFAAGSFGVVFIFLSRHGRFVSLVRGLFSGLGTVWLALIVLGYLLGSYALVGALSFQDSAHPGG